MSMNCTRCEGSGFLNMDQLPDEWHEFDHDKILSLLPSIKEPHDVQVCDCCGDGEYWHGVAGEHYNSEDPQGETGPYNEGLSQCH